ncbi:hypothetical protein K501DRAFT_271613 [Backusella circina FSU 941]|nr:hypothetical protein K501DRAFT_271613 [Backusella circina FSU 941]
MLSFYVFFLFLLIGFLFCLLTPILSLRPSSLYYGYCLKKKGTAKSLYHCPWERKSYKKYYFCFSSLLVRRPNDFGLVKSICHKMMKQMVKQFNSYYIILEKYFFSIMDLPECYTALIFNFNMLYIPD